MKEITGDIWPHYNNGAIICITTNGIVTKDGRCVMGRGIAQQAAQRWPTLPHTLGTLIKQNGNHVYRLPYDLFSFPVKHHWKYKADVDLIRRSAEELLCQVNEYGLSRIYMVRPGCGNGGLSWEQVRPLLDILDDRFIVVEWNPTY